MLQQLQEWFSTHRQAILADFFRFLEFKSISADSTYQQDILACAKWLGDYLRVMGMKVQLWPTSSGHPVVFAERKSPVADAPTLMIYHHYDVQPVDPMDLWKSDPFKPMIKGDLVYARGAQDNKGQCFYSILALKAFFEMTQQLPLNVKLFIEGEEESGSHGTEEMIDGQKASLKADSLLVIDSDLAGPGIPALTMGVRGILSFEFSCRNASIDLHSGMFGGIVYNPNRALAEAIAAIWDPKGRVKVPHFYDDVEELSKEHYRLLDLSFSQEEMSKQFGIKAFAPEIGFSPRESSWIRPTVEINGICGGYTGKGFKTVIPAEAFAKISCRLVPHQKPEKIYRQLCQYLEEHLPKGFEAKADLIHGTPAFRSNFDSLIAKTAVKAYEEVMKVPCRYKLSGGSIPIVGKLAEVSGAETVLMGFGLDEDNVHAPNECFGLKRFEQGFLTVGTLLANLSKTK
jgi:acetylornithine deacetylase/succinyl-diaminopimelate desuccinylase-like protein